MKFLSKSEVELMHVVSALLFERLFTNIFFLILSARFFVIVANFFYVYYGQKNEI